METKYQAPDTASSHGGSDGAARRARRRGRRTARAAEGKIVANFSLPREIGMSRRVSRKMATHLYLVPRSLVNAVGGFDPSFRTCEDWDLFQRIARTGARFGGVPEILAAYRMRAGSATTNGYQRFADGIRVLTQGHAPDPRVLAPHPVYPNGLPKHELAKHKFGLACACAGYVIGNGGDARSLLDVLKNERHPSMDPYEVAAGIIIHALVSASRPQTDWYKLWPSLKRNIKEFLIALEEHSGTGVTSRARL